ncbi:MAG: hypothetical protein J6A75_07545 [Lachnospiraceae bacterium]|nr:hypothetical protein [Lachnospiraceae bacterium]
MREKLKKISYKTVGYYLVVFFLIAIRCKIQSELPIWANGNNYHDDMLLNNYADTIRQGQWLGDYNNGALCKVPGFSIFLVINNMLNIPYMITASLLYGLAAFMLLLGMQKIYKKKWLPFILFLFILFSPVYFEVTVASRLYCVSLIPTTIVFMLAGTVGTFAERKSRWTKKLPWLILLGAAHGFYAWLRADVIWMTCFVGVAVLAFIIEGCIRREGKKVLIFLIPVVLYLGAANLLCAINYSQYGVYTMSDFTGTGFSDMCKELMKIKPEKERNKSYVSLKTLKKVANISETFKPLYKQIKKDVKAGANMNAEYYAWEIRGAMQTMGYYKDAAETDAFYKQVCLDIQQAFEDGVFEKRDALVLSPFAGPIYIEKIGDVIVATIDNIVDSVICYDKITASSATFTGTDLSYGIMSDLTNTKLIHDSNVHVLKFRGWMFAIEEESTLEAYLYDINGKEYPIEFQETDRIYDALNKEFENAKNSYFDMTWSGYSYETKDLSIRIILDGMDIYDGLLEYFPAFTADGFLMHVDELVIGEQSDALKMQLKSIDWLVERINQWIAMYQRTGIFIAWIAMGVFGLDLLFQIYLIVKKQKNQVFYWILKAGVLLTLFALTFAVRVHDLAYYEEFGITYGIGAFTIWQIFIALNGLTLGNWGQEVFLRIKKQQDTNVKEI